MSFSYTDNIASFSINSSNALVLRGYNTGGGVFCCLVIRTTQNDKTTDAEHTNVFIPRTTVSGLTGLSFTVLNTLNFGDTAKRVTRAAQVASGVLTIETTEFVLNKKDKYALELRAMLIPEATLSEADIVGGIGPGIREEVFTAAGGTQTFTLATTPTNSVSSPSGKNILGVFVKEPNGEMVYPRGERNLFVSSATRFCEYDMPSANQIRIPDLTTGATVMVVYG